MFGYHFHGIDVHSEIPLGLDQKKKPIALRVLTIIRKKWPLIDLPDPIWQSEDTMPDGGSCAFLHLLDGVPILRLPRTGLFRVTTPTIEGCIEEHAHPGPFILGRVFGLWLELVGFPVLHGACLKGRGSAFGLLGCSGMGKSTLSAALHARGCRLVTDDLIPLVTERMPPMVYPGIPISRMWPDTGKTFIANFDSFEKVHPDFEKRKIPDQAGGKPRFTKEAGSLEKIYILERDPARTRPVLERLTPAAALVELVAMSYHPGPVHALGLQPARLKCLSRMLESVSVYKLRYPSGFDKLNRVCDVVLAGAAA